MEKTQTNTKGETINMMMKIDHDFIDFIKTCFSSEALDKQHDRYEYGEYPLLDVLQAFEKYKSKEWNFDYNCSDCSFPKFEKKDGYTEACPICGD